MYWACSFTGCLLGVLYLSFNIHKNLKGELLLIIPIIEIRKLRPRELNKLPKVTQIRSDGG